MARLVFPDEGDRLAYGQLSGVLQSAANTVLTVWADAAGTILADIQTLAGSPIVGSQITVDTNSLIPQFLGPDGDVRDLWVSSAAVPTPFPILAQPVRSGAFAIITPGTTYVARKCADDTVISSNTDFKTVLQAAINAAAAAGGGRVELAHGAYSLDSSGVTIANPGLIQLVGKGGHSFNRQNSEAGVGTVITATGTWTSNTDMIKLGALGAGNYAAACLISNIAFDGAGKDINIIHGQNAQDLKIEGCTFTDISKVNPRKFVWLESDQATNAGSGANPKILNCWMRNGYHALYVSGTGSSDGEIGDCDIWSCVRTIEIHGGGWMVRDNHLVGNATDTDYHLFIDAVHPMVTGNYFDSAKTTGWMLEFSTGMTNGMVTGNFFLTGTAGGIGIRLTAPRAVISGNTFLTQGGPFVKFNGVAATFANIVGNGGQGPSAGIIQDQTGADITADASGTNFRRLANVIL